MAKFCFYHGEDIEIVNRLRRSAIFCWGSIKEIERDSFRLFVAADDYEHSFCATENVVGAISGYAVFDGAGAANRTEHHRRFLTEISEKEWSLGDDWTGSFAAAAYSKANGEITLCNDIIGHFPLYYARAEGDLVGGTNLIVLSRTLKCETDAIGVLQRITVPFCNYGRRTLLKNVFRLLPGERLKWAKGNGDIRREYDNSLCRESIDTDVKTAARQVWDCLQKEITAAASDERIAVAVSGGWDSRLVLGGIRQRGSSAACLTYGGTDHYETRIARRCAEAIGASHECFPIDGKYFPSRRQTEPLIKETESANYFEWFGMLEKARLNDAKVPLLLGDLCESIDGRYMTAFSTRKARVNSFLRGLTGATSESFAAANDAAFERWRNEKRSEITAALLANLPRLSVELSGSLTKEEIVSEIASDLELSFARVCDHEPLFAAMYDELFIWFHRIRFLLGNQITWLGAAFRPVSPGLSMRFLRFITTIHPRLRIRKRLMNAIIRLPEFDCLARIPSAQIPFVTSRAPDLIKDVLWGTRSGLDQLLIKRTLKNKKANGRQRVLRSLDYVKEYRRNTSAANVESWFSDEYIKSDSYLRVFRERAALNAWTLINVDIAAPANVSIILDLCRENAEKNAPLKTNAQSKSAATIF